MNKYFRLIVLMFLTVMPFISNAQTSMSPFDQYKRGWHYYKEGNYTQAVQWLRKAAEQNNNIAQSLLGLCYEQGKGVTKDYNEAAKWMRKAADQGLAAAQYKMGDYYHNGYGIPKDYKEAVKWYHKAAGQGLAEAQNALGYHYEHGEGVSKNYSEAVKWYRKAAEQGNAAAQNNLGLCYLNGNGVPKNFSEAVKLFRKAAEQGNAAAQYDMGLCYENGYGVPKNYTEAVKWYRKAAGQGDDDAKKALARLGQATTPSTPTTPAPRRNNVAGTTTNRVQARPANDYPAYSHDNISGFNGAKNYGFLGLSAGYVSKQMVNKYDDGHKERTGMWPDSKTIGGLQVGFKIEPQFRFGFGLDTGIFYEYYFTKNKRLPFDAWREASGKVNMHYLCLPIHLEWRANFSEFFQLFAYGGVGLDYCVGADLTLKDADSDEEIWKSDDFFDDSFIHDMNRFNASLEYGVGLRVSCLQLNFTMANGLIDMSDNSAYKTYMNKNAALSLSVIF